MKNSQVDQAHVAKKSGVSTPAKKPLSESRINVTRSSMPSYEEYCEEIKELWESRWLSNAGAKHKEFARAFCQSDNFGRD